MSLTVARPDLFPDPALDREAMERLQRSVAEAARFADDFDSGVNVDPGADPAVVGGDGPAASGGTGADSPGRPVVAAVDQAFLDGRAVGAAVAVRGGTGETVARGDAVADLPMPYVPGLLSFREAEAAVGALRDLDSDLDAAPAVVLVDGSGRIHFREAGLATHLGVLFDLPTVGVAKSLLCGRPRESTEDMPAGRRVAILADDSVTAPDGTVIGHAVQTRQYDSPNRSINPVYASPGHRVSADTAADLVAATADRYKLPAPIRRADRHADRRKRALTD